MLKTKSTKGSKSSARRRTCSAFRLDQLGGRAMNVVTTILNSIADYGNCCGIEKLAEQFRTTPNRLNSALKKLGRDGLIRITGRLYPTVYPTVKMLRQQNVDLSEAEAAKIIRHIERT